MKQNVTIKINKKATSEKDYIKYLRVLVDSSMSWKYQISNLTKKISRAIGIMYKLTLLMRVPDISWNAHRFAATPPRYIWELTSLNK